MPRTMLTYPLTHCLLAVIGLVTLLTAVAPPARADLIQNGGFETGDFTDWAVSGNVGIGGVPTYGFVGNATANGNYVAVFNAGDQPANATLSQVISTVIGAEYSLSFDYSSLTEGGFQSITVSAIDAGGTTLNSLFGTATNTNSLGTSTFSFRADSTATTISIADFAGNNTYSNDGFLDNISVSAVPEPFSLSLFATGLAGITLLRRRKTG